jgi:hypothetical protein
MKIILADNAEKYSELICEAKLKSDEMTTLKNMLKNPETIKFISFNFSDDSPPLGVDVGVRNQR